MDNPFEGLPKPSFPSAEKPADDVFGSLRRAYEVQGATQQEAPEQMTAGQQAVDVVKGGASGLGRGVVSTPGLPGDIGQLIKQAPALGSYAYGRGREMLGYSPKGEAAEKFQKDLETARSGMSEAERSGKYGQLFGYEFPTGQYFVEKASEYVPGLTYAPKTGAGRVAGSVGEVLGSSLTTRGLTSGLKGLKSAPAAATDVGAGVGSGIAGEMTTGSPDEALARLAGTVPGALAGRAAYGRLSGAAATERGERIAGDVARGQIRDVEGAKTALQTPGEYVPGVKPTSPQTLRGESGISGLETELRAAQTPGSAATRIAMEQSQEGLTSATQKAIEGVEAKLPYASMADAFNLPVGGNPRAISSEAAQNAFRAVEQPMFDAADQAWKHPSFKTAVYDKNVVVGALNNAFKDMGISRLGLPKEMNDYISQLRKYPDAGIPFSELQKVKRLANQIVRDPTVRDRAGAIELTTKLDDVLTNPLHLMTPVAPGTDAAKAFDTARTATREYKTLFETPNVAALAERYPKGTTQAGQYVVQPEQMLDQVFGNSKTALARYRELQKIPGMDISTPASDWIVSKITNNGEKATLSSNDVAKFLRDPGNNALVNEIPGLRQRLDGIAQQSMGEQVRNSFAAAMDSPNPTKLSQYINKNRSLIDQVFTQPHEQQLVDALDRSSKILASVPSGTPLDRSVLDRLMKGDLFTILHGKITGKLGEATAGMAAGKLIGMTAPVAAGLETLGAGAITSGFFPKAQTMLANVIYGTTQEQAVAALNKAMRDPAYMNLLLSKPTIVNSMTFLKGLLPYTAGQAATRGVLGSRDLNPPAPAETTDAAYNRLVKEGRIRPLTSPGPGNKQASGGRAQRASGGRIAPESKADALVKAAESAKKQINQGTEALLDQPDETITRALAVAKKHI